MERRGVFNSDHKSKVFQSTSGFCSCCTTPSEYCDLWSIPVVLNRWGASRLQDGLSDCSITEEGYKALASALRSNTSHLIELDLTGNDPGQSGVKQLCDLLQDGHCSLQTVRFFEKSCCTGSV
ncbi:hypothetical protein G5714_021469 [Onychostoma macrolepis]|uniref:Uncharacterized protein n=1 Tax=Onychostoma macrolepis TaxID=369639 RepID=A0A7J6BRU5_9TELE|nr:hypothetical protein G5714_021469 [Onychostoma macrolepis]